MAQSKPIDVSGIFFSNLEGQRFSPEELDFVVGPDVSFSRLNLTSEPYLKQSASTAGH